MDILYTTRPWNVLIDTCMKASPDTNPTPNELDKHGGYIKRWDPYVKKGLVHEPQTEAHFQAFAFKVVTPKVINALKDKHIFNAKHLREEVANCFSGDTSRFNFHSENTLIKDLAYEAIVRISVLCYALNQSRALRVAGKKNANQILVDTLNTEAVYFDRLASILSGFKEVFWNDSETSISRICEEFVYDSANLQHLTLCKQKLEEEGLKVLDTEQIPAGIALAR